MVSFVLQIILLSRYLFLQVIGEDTKQDLMNKIV